MTRETRDHAPATAGDSAITVDPWHALRRFTAARIALGRTGSSLPTAPLLAFNLSHAQARDAVHTPLDTALLRRELDKRALDSVEVCSAAENREQYLRRPDLGRMLDVQSAACLVPYAGSGTARTDLVFVIADGLSANAAALHAIPLIDRTIAQLRGWRIGPVVVATQARVAIGDPIGALLNADMVAVLIGERPGLSSPASLGVYLTYRPATGRSDAERNCISNVRPEGLSYDVAAFKLVHLLEAARTMKLTGVGLKDESVWCGDVLPAADDSLDSPA
ncbi:ethanolamine ammonia-lyase subunit EutC [Paraburkholderia sartisoli]|uniref:Ethanolamine ammonia-lyase small subunit n=1 Tax=Paraburkholderia sartisoli TaxID=83784 RepID=A0A1H4H3A2_9BURK|nr:ethanolamine ammonia-lyase subunit EutC [Paraburkholderia sartisoli]SEB16254.1 Ethanolamine ammonia-lyase light chain [Paraburkholderia sartisoli]